MLITSVLSTGRKGHDTGCSWRWCAWRNRVVLILPRNRRYVNCSSGLSLKGVLCAEDAPLLISTACGHSLYIQVYFKETGTRNICSMAMNEAIEHFQSIFRY
ncbi:uncharacterized protein [Lolium perenne]|uniref:uncharacterized protein n=1 Tax=Lolium perenne TaxID=4522 RepID=UPI003A99C916